MSVPILARLVLGRVAKLAWVAQVRKWGWLNRNYARHVHILEGHSHIRKKMWAGNTLEQFWHLYLSKWNLKKHQSQELVWIPFCIVCYRMTTGKPYQVSAFQLFIGGQLRHRHEGCTHGSGTRTTTQGTKTFGTKDATKAMIDMAITTTLPGAERLLEDLWHLGLQT